MYKNEETIHKFVINKFITTNTRYIQISEAYCILCKTKLNQSKPNQNVNRQKMILFYPWQAYNLNNLAESLPSLSGQMVQCSKVQTFWSPWQVEKIIGNQHCQNSHQFGDLLPCH